MGEISRQDAAQGRNNPREATHEPAARPESHGEVHRRNNGKNVSPLPVSVRTETTAVEECTVATERNINNIASVDASGCRIGLRPPDAAPELGSRALQLRT